VGPLRLLAIFASVRSITPVFAHVLNAVRETRFGMKLGLLSVVLYPAAFYVGSRWGTVGIAAAWILVHPIMLFPLYVRVFHTTQLKLSHYLNALRIPFEGALVMSVGILLLKLYLRPELSLILRLALQIVAGASLYVGDILLFHYRRVAAIYR